MLRLSVFVAAILAAGAPPAYGGVAFSSPPALLVGDDVAGGQNNAITVFIPLGIAKYRVAENTLPMTVSTGCTATADPTEVDCNPFQIEEVAAFLHEGNDSFQENIHVPAVVSGGDGNDTVGGGSANDQLEGDTG